MTWKPRLIQTFDRHPSSTNNYRDATGWQHGHSVSGAMEEMTDGSWVVTLEGADAQRVLDLEHPIDPAGFRLTEIERFA